MYQKVADISVFGLSGDLDNFEARQLLRSLAQLIRRQWVKIVLDFGEVDHIQYQVLNDLVSVAVASHSLQGGVKLVHLNNYHKNILKVAGVSDYFEVYETLADAILSFHDTGAPSARTC